MSDPITILRRELDRAEQDLVALNELLRQRSEVVEALTLDNERLRQEHEVLARENADLRGTVAGLQQIYDRYEKMVEPQIVAQREQIVTMHEQIKRLYAHVGIALDVKGGGR